MILLYHSISFICNRNYANRFIIVILVIFFSEMFDILKIDDVTDDVIGVVGSIFWVILRVYIYDVIISKFHQNRSVNKKSTGGGQNPHPPW